MRSSWKAVLGVGMAAVSGGAFRPCCAGGIAGSVAQEWPCTRPSSKSRSSVMIVVLSLFAYFAIAGAAGAGLPSWNCAASVLCAMAVVLEVPPEAAVATASK